MSTEPCALILSRLMAVRVMALGRLAWFEPPRSQTTPGCKRLWFGGHEASLTSILIYSSKSYLF